MSIQWYLTIKTLIWNNSLIGSLITNPFSKDSTKELILNSNNTMEINTAQFLLRIINIKTILIKNHLIRSFNLEVMHISHKLKNLSTHLKII